MRKDGIYNMVLFRTKFPVSNDFTQSEFLNLLGDYVAKSDLYSLKPVFDDAESGEYIFEDENQKLLVYKTREYVAAQLSKSDDDKMFVNTYILTSLQDVRVMFIRLEQMSNQMSSQVDFKLQIPQFIRDIFWREYGGDDNGLFVDDKPFLLRKKDMDLAESIFKKKLQFLNPIVYVTPEADTGHYRIDCYELAAKLLGVAHVMVAGSPYIAELVQTLIDTDIELPSDGNVLLLLPNGDTNSFSSNVTVDMIIDYIYEIMINVTVEDELSFSKLRLSYLLSNTASDSDLNEICEELLSEKDTTIYSLQKELETVNQQLSDLKAKSDALSYSLGRSKSDVKTSLQISLNEQPLYEHELEDVILKILRKEYDSMTGDKNLIKSRKYHVLSDIVKSNEVSSVPDEIHDIFDKNMKEGTMSREGVQAAKRYGFEISKCGNGHYKLVYKDDERYQMAMSSSPSDNRSGDNLVTSYMNMLFGY